MASKKDDFYFESFIKSVETTCRAAAYLKTTLESFDPATLDTKLSELHEIEHIGDKVKHDIVAKIASAFITPLERDDILALAQEIDNVTDSIEDILVRIYINNVSAIRPDALDFADVLIKICDATLVMLKEFQDFRKSKLLRDKIIEVNRIEELGDDIYIRSMRKLHTTESDVKLIIAWREIYEFFEKSCDACEDVADIVESIAIDNT